MIGYYAHHHGFGHLARALSIGRRMRRPVTVLTSRKVPHPHPFAAVIELPRDDCASYVSEPTAHGALHWAPHHDPGFGARMQAIAQWVRDAQPEAFVVDISVEVASFVRLLGVPLIVIALPGARTDGPHQMVHQLADHIIAAWPQDLAEPEWLRPHAAKTSYVGGISRFEGRPRIDHGDFHSATNILVLAGAEGIGVDTAAVEDLQGSLPDTRWTFVGASSTEWTADPWPRICAADVIVTHAGQGCIADVAAAHRPTVVIPQPRPFDEQHATAAVLNRACLAAVVERWPPVEQWPALLERALSWDPTQWRRWRIDGAPDRAAHAIEATARQSAARVAS
jgi:hypothetical protein